jgi:hypothetical protein
MMTKLAAQEIYLLEKFSSPGYLAELRDTWRELLEHVEHCLDHFMQNPPAEFRNLPLPGQPHAVWGERVLPNFRETYQGLCSGVIELKHGNAKGLRSANGPFNDYKGQREYSTAWMPENDSTHYFELLNKANRMAGDICATEEPYWEPGDLLNYHVRRGSIDLPDNLPSYRRNAAKTVVTNDLVRQSGIYIPDVEGSCAEFLNDYNTAPPAIVLVRMQPLINPENGEQYGEEPTFEDQPCVWTLVERDAVSMPGPAAKSRPAPRRMNV